MHCSFIGTVIFSQFILKGALYSGEEFTSFAMKYFQKCWGIFEDLYRQRPGPPFELTVKLRQFLWMLDVII